MNSFDLMIEKYKKELVDAKSKSILEALDDIDARAEEIVNEAVTQDEQEPQTDEQQYSDDETTEAETVISDEENQADEPQSTEDAQQIFSETAEETAVSEATAQPQTANDEEDNSAAAVSGAEYQPPYLGTLKVQVFAADQSYPIGSALVTVTGSDDKKQYFKGYTDTSGIVDDISLPSVRDPSPDLPTDLPSFIKYDITVEHPRFTTNNYLDVPVFAGIKSIQTVQLVPIGNGENEENTFTETEPNDLMSAEGMAAKEAENG